MKEFAMIMGSIGVVCSIAAFYQAVQLIRLLLKYRREPIVYGQKKEK